MVTTTSQLDEMAQAIEDLEGALRELPTLIFILKIGLHQARRARETEEAALLMMEEVEALDVALEAL